MQKERTDTGVWELGLRQRLANNSVLETARQAGLVRYSSSSGESDRDLYALPFHKPQPTRNISTSSALKKGCRNGMVKDKENMKMNLRKQGKVCDVTEQGRKPVRKHLHDAVPRSPPHRRAPKPVDEDLYKIPPELLRTTKRKKMLGFISKCLVPAACVS